jgi:hypothetical protein
MKKKSLVGWTSTGWKHDFKRTHHTVIMFPEIWNVKTMRGQEEGTQGKVIFTMNKKVRITIEEVK